MRTCLVLMLSILYICSMGTAANAFQNAPVMDIPHLERQEQEETASFPAQIPPPVKLDNSFKDMSSPPSPASSYQQAFAIEGQSRLVEGFQPLTAECLAYAASAFNIPQEVFFLILDVERGTVGSISQNKNGTYDMGPMQINSCHVERFTKAGITESALRNNGCVNLLAGAALLNMHRKTVANDSDWLEIMGRYHSRTPEKKAKYQGAILKRWNTMTQLSANSILSHANLVSISQR